MKYLNTLLALLGGIGGGAAMQHAGSGDTLGISDDVREFLSHVSMRSMEDGQGGYVRTVFITGLNVQIVNGLGATETRNGAGNLVVGYNEFLGHIDPTRTGSHNILCGYALGYKAFGGIAVGFGNVIGDQYCVAVGGREGSAEAPYASVFGGDENDAFGSYSTVLGGYDGNAIGGGACVAGGESNHAFATSSVIIGGISNSTDGERSVVTGGVGNRASGDVSVVSGGASRSALGQADWVAGSLWEDQ